MAQMDANDQGTVNEGYDPETEKPNSRELTKENPTTNRENQDRWVVESRSRSIISSTTFCRICLDGGQKEELVRVCRCDGSVGLIHQSCILTWYQATGQKACELCRYAMNIESTGIKSFVKWSCPSRTGAGFTLVYFSLSILCFFFIIASVMLLGMIDVECWYYYCITPYVALVCGVFILVYCYVTARGMWPIAKSRWLLVNSNWKIQPYITENQVQSPPPSFSPPPSPPSIPEQYITENQAQPVESPPPSFPSSPSPPPIPEQYTPENQTRPVQGLPPIADSNVISNC